MGVPICIVIGTMAAATIEASLIHYQTRPQGHGGLQGQDMAVGELKRK